MGTTTTRTYRAVAGTVTSFMQYGLLMVLQFVLAPVVLRAAGQEVLGAYSFLMQIVSWATLTDLGFGVAIGRNLAQAVGIDDQRQRFRKIFITGRTFYIASNLAFAGLVFIMGWKINIMLPMSYNIENEARLSLYLLAIWVVIRTPVSLFADALIATQNIAAVNIIVAVGNALRLILSLGLVALGTSLIGLMLATIIAEAAMFIMQRAWYYRCYPEDKFGWGIPDQVLFWEMLGFGLTYMVMIVAGRLSASTDSIIVGHFYGAAAVSIYYISQTPGSTLYQLIWKLTDNSAPAFNELYARQASSQLNNAYLRLLRYSLLLVIPLSVGLIGYNRWAITIWMGQVQYAGDILTITLAVFAITQVIIHLNAIILVAYGNIRLMSVFGLCGGVVKVLLAIWLSRTIGLQGVMLANMIVDLPGLIFFSHLVWRLLGLDSRQVYRRAIIPAISASLFTLPVLFWVITNPPATSLPSFIIWVVIFALMWTLGTGSFGLPASERTQLFYFIKRTLVPALGKKI